MQIGINSHWSDASVIAMVPLPSHHTPTLCFASLLSDGDEMRDTRTKVDLKLYKGVVFPSHHAQTPCFAQQGNTLACFQMDTR